MLKNNWFVVSGTVSNRVFYQKTMLVDDSNINSAGKGPATGGSGMKRSEFNVLVRLPLAVLLAILLFIPAAARSANENCGERDESVQNTCKYVKYKELPSDLKKFMTKMKCNVKTGSNYDYGYAVDLNSDGNPEYAFCCREAKHGPCDMTIFGKSSTNWEALYDHMPGFDDEGPTPCFGFAALKTKHSGYNDLCIDDGAAVIIYRDGKYRDAPESGR